eukprot:364355-Chlamydomonas_euryale.AAC.2
MQTRFSTGGGVSSKEPWERFVSPHTRSGHTHTQTLYAPFPEGGGGSFVCARLRTPPPRRVSAFPVCLLSPTRRRAPRTAHRAAPFPRRREAPHVRRSRARERRCASRSAAAAATVRVRGARGGALFRRALGEGAAASCCAGLGSD